MTDDYPEFCGRCGQAVPDGPARWRGWHLVDNEPVCPDCVAADPVLRSHEVMAHLAAGLWDRPDDEET